MTQQGRDSIGDKRLGVRENADTCDADFVILMMKDGRLQRTLQAMAKATSTACIVVGRATSYVALPPELSLRKQEQEVQRHIRWIHVTDPATSTTSQPDDDVSDMPAVRAIAWHDSSHLCSSRGVVPAAIPPVSARIASPNCILEA